MGERRRERERPAEAGPHELAPASEPAPVDFEALLKNLTTKPGVYRMVGAGGEVLYSSRTLPRPGAAADLPHAAALGPLLAGASRAVEHPTEGRAADGGAPWKHVTLAGAGEGAGAPRLVQVGLPVPDRSPASPRFAETLAG